MFHLSKDRESYELYVTNIYWGDSLGDDLVASAIGRMFNWSITILTAMWFKPTLLHNGNETNPDIIIVTNEGDPCSTMPCTYFSATEKNKYLGPAPIQLPFDANQNGSYEGIS